MFIHDKDIGWWCRCPTSGCHWCDLHWPFDFGIVTLTIKILSGLYRRNSKGAEKLILWSLIGVQHYAVTLVYNV